MKNNVIIRADGGTSIGMGHVVRCLALADMLKDDFNIVFAIQESEESIVNTIRTVTQNIILLPFVNDYERDISNFESYLKPGDIIVLDGYNFKTEYQKRIKDKGCKLICIDDLHAWHQMADVIINHAGEVDKSKYSVEEYTKFCLGLNFLLLRKPFLVSVSTVRKINTIRKVFISMGAADVNNLTQKFTEALLKANGIEEIHLMLGAINPHLKSLERLIENNKQLLINTHFNIAAEELMELLKSCDLAICPASSISLECCAVGIGLISGYTAENQIGNLAGMEGRNTLINFGNLNQLSTATITNKISRLIANATVFNELLYNQKQMIDGKSPERLLNVFRKLDEEKLHFRFATASDTLLYYNWTNDALVRNNSFNQLNVDYTIHVEWFNSKLKSEDCFFYLFFNPENIPVGQVRIDKSGDEIVIGISIDKEFRGKSLGVEMLEKSCYNYLQKTPSATIFAYIKIENTASFSIFKKAGFLQDEMVEVKGQKCYKLRKKYS